MIEEGREGMSRGGWLVRRGCGGGGGVIPPFAFRLIVIIASSLLLHDGALALHEGHKNKT